jgi:V8-like Glu-specific endopeptidase
VPRREARAGAGRRGGPGIRAVTRPALGALAIGALAFGVMTPARDVAGRTARRPGAISPAHMTTAPVSPGQAAKPFGGIPAVGALFTTTASGQLGAHFCTASVVHSPHRDLLITAAHCVWPRSGVIDFVPGYEDGSAPYGIWTVTRVIVDPAWAASANPDDDVAFLVVARTGSGLRIENVTGAERLGIGQGPGQQVEVIGYPNGGNLPVMCQGRTSLPLPHQLEFDCGDYTEGTSGGPFLGNAASATGDGTVVGVIGGYQQGGDLPQISYSAAFGQNVAALYQTAVGES